MRFIRAALAGALLALTGAASGQALDHFLRAVNQGDTLTAAKLLDKGVDPDTADSSGLTALMIASRLGNTEMAALLINRKANVGRQSAFGDTAINLAALGGHLKVVELLLAHGAVVSPLVGWGPLHYAAFENRAEVVKYLILKGAKKDALAPNGDRKSVV